MSQIVIRLFLRRLAKSSHLEPSHCGTMRRNHPEIVPARFRSRRHAHLCANQVVLYLQNFSGHLRSAELNPARILEILSTDCQFNVSALLRAVREEPAHAGARRRNTLAETHAAQHQPSD